MTNTFKQRYPNTENKSPQSIGGSAKFNNLLPIPLLLLAQHPLLRRYSRRFIWEAPFTMMNKKFWIRWVSIALICAAYYAIVLYFDLVFALNFTETMSPGEFTLLNVHSLLKDSKITLIRL